MSTPYGFELVENCLTCSLRNASFFCQLPPAALATLQRIKQTSVYPRGSVLFSEGQETRGVFILCRGRVKLTVNSREGKEMILKLVRPGEVLGLNAAILGREYEATAETMYPCQVDFIRHDDFLRFLKQHGEVVLQAAQHMGRYCDSAYDTIRSLGLIPSVQERLAKLLVDLAADCRAGSGINIGLCHEELAQLIGSSRESVTRTLGDFKRNKIAELKGATLRILDRDAIAAMALA